MARPKEQGRKEESKLLGAIGARFNERPGELELELVARGLGVEPSKLPNFDTIGELQIWVFSLHGLMGSEQHFKELVERVVPKASRARVDNPRPGPVAGAMGAAGLSSTSEADLWFDSLSTNPEDEELM